MRIDETETRLRETLQILGARAVTSPDAYASARRKWQRRERRRRLLTVILALLVVAAADAVGLWVLSTRDNAPPAPYNQPVNPEDKHRLDDVVIMP